MTLDAIELWIGRLGGVTGFGTLGAAMWALLNVSSRPTGRESGAARSLLRWPLFIIGLFVFVGYLVLLWLPLPIAFSLPARVVLLILGTLVYFSGVGLYVWGLRTLGSMFGASSEFGVRLYANHRLITRGPYAHVRHPMYLGIMLIGLGGLLLYRTWAMAFFALGMFGLMRRARREEQVLEQEFGQEWVVYARHVPAWLPRLQR